MRPVSSSHPRRAPPSVKWLGSARLANPDALERLTQLDAIGDGTLSIVEHGGLEHATFSELRRVERADREPGDISMKLSEHALRVWGPGGLAFAADPGATTETHARRRRHAPRRVRRRQARVAPRIGPTGPAAENPLAHGTSDPTDRRRRESAPPPGSDTIVRLNSLDVLIDEGKRQHNCVAELAPAVARGRWAVYRVLSPERCTLSLELREGRWVIDRLKAARNRAPSSKTLGAVSRWLLTNRFQQVEPRRAADSGVAC